MLDDTARQPQQDLRDLLDPLDAWRQSLADKMHVSSMTGTNVYYLHMQAMSYRYECILCRLLRRRWRQAGHPGRAEWARQRLHSAMLELDTIARRVLASGTLLEYPVSLYVDSKPLPHATGRTKAGLTCTRQRYHDDSASRSPHRKRS